MKKKLLFIIVILSLIFELKASSLDNILKAIIYTQNDSSFLILQERIYHPTSGSYEKGNLRSQGYNTSRISVYDFSSGKLLAQKDMGVIDSAQACIVLGCSYKNLWIYHKKFHAGLHSLNPITLERSISQAKIYSKMVTNIGLFYEPDWREIQDYYGYDPIQQKLIVTNINLSQYYIDIESYTNQAITEKLNLNQTLNKYLTVSAVFNDSTWTLKGYDNMQFTCNNTTAQEPTYLFGKFILEQNTIRLFKHFLTVQDNIDANKGANAQEIIRNAKNNIESLINGNKPDEVLLQTEANAFYVLSKTSNEADAFLKISKIESTQFGRFHELWSTSLQGMFYNIAQARNTPLFKKYFGDTNPEFNYQFIQTQGDKMVIIYLSYVYCLNVKTGNPLWYFKLK